MEAKHHTHKTKINLFLKRFEASWWWNMSLIPAHRRQSQADLCEFKANLLYEVELQDSQDYREKPLSRKIKQNNKRFGKTISVAFFFIAIRNPLLTPTTWVGTELKGGAFV